MIYTLGKTDDAQTYFSKDVVVNKLDYEVTAQYSESCCSILMVRNKNQRTDIMMLTGEPITVTLHCGERYNIDLQTKDTLVIEKA